MSRIGKLPVEIPAETEVQLEGSCLKVKSSKGELTQKISSLLSVEIAEGEIRIKPRKETKKASELYGLTRTLVANMIKGVSEGFEKKLEFHGVGYRAAVENGKLVMHLGFSHPINFPAPEGIEIKVEKNTITISGIDKQKVGQVAADIRDLKKPEPYKGKGIKYQGEHIRRKAGKTAAKAAA